MTDKLIGKTIGTIVLAGVLALGNIGCSKEKDHSEYNYNGKIGEDEVFFYERENSSWFKEDYNILEINKPDGRFIRYTDEKGEDLIVDDVYISKKGVKDLRVAVGYDSNNEVDQPVLKEAQKQFDLYLQKIKETKTQEQNEKINQSIEDLK